MAGCGAHSLAEDHLARLYTRGVQVEGLYPRQSGVGILLNAIQPHLGFATVAAPVGDPLNILATDGNGEGRVPAKGARILHRSAVGTTEGRGSPAASVNDGRVRLLVGADLEGGTGRPGAQVACLVLCRHSITVGGAWGKRRRDGGCRSRRQRDVGISTAVNAPLELVASYAATAWVVGSRPGELHRDGGGRERRKRCEAVCRSLGCRRSGIPLINTELADCKPLCCSVNIYRDSTKGSRTFTVEAEVLRAGAAAHGNGTRGGSVVRRRRCVVSSEKVRLDIEVESLRVRRECHHHLVHDVRVDIPGVAVAPTTPAAT